MSNKNCRHNDTEMNSKDSRECLDCGAIIKTRNVPNAPKNLVKQMRRDSERSKELMLTSPFEDED